MDTEILEIGPGTVDCKSKLWVKADTLDLLEGGTYKAHWGYETLPIESNRYDLVFASHVLEHIVWYRVDFAVAEVARVLKETGKFTVFVPNFHYLLECYLQGKLGDNWRVFNPENDLITWLNGRIFSYDVDAKELLGPDRPIPQTIHKCVFTPASLTKLLSKHFKHVMPIVRDQHSHGPIEMGFTASNTEFFNG